MSKVAILTDSNSGITQAQSKDMGVTVIPMPFFIDGVEYLEDINLTQEEFYEKLKNDADISTSQPSIGTLQDYFDELLKDNDEVVFIPMSSGLSGTCQTATMVAGDYDGKVQVVNNQRISVTMRQSVIDAKALADKGKNAEEIKDILEAHKMDSSIYITLETLKYLKKGGRITPAAAAIGTMLKLNPVLQIQGEKLDAFAKARGKASAKKIMLKAMKDDCDYDGKVQVVNNQRISVTMRQSVIDAKALADKGKNAEEIKDILEAHKMDSSIYITLETLKYLKKGGRITPAAAAIGTMLKLNPVLQIQGEKLDAFAKARGKASAKKIMLKAMKDDCDNRFKDYAQQGKLHMEVAYTGNEGEAREWAEAVKEAFPQYDFYMAPLSLSIACHIGYGSLAIAVSAYVPEAE